MDSECMKSSRFSFLFIVFLSPISFLSFFILLQSKFFHTLFASSPRFSLTPFQDPLLSSKGCAPPLSYFLSSVSLMWASRLILFNVGILFRPFIFSILFSFSFLLLNFNALHCFKKMSKRRRVIERERGGETERSWCYIWAEKVDCLRSPAHGRSWEFATFR